MRIVLVGSGTGGHFYPLIAIAESIRAADRSNNTDTELFFVGPEPYNQDALDSQRISFVYCPAGKRRLYRSIRNYLDVGKTAFGFFVAFWRLLLLYPDVVMSKGGYTSVPVILAAWLLRIPIVIHESDAVAGRGNKLAAHFARYIAIAHDDAAAFFPKEKVALVGMPIRTSFFVQAKDPYTPLGIPTDRPVVLVTGGSLGAERINNLILNSLDELLPFFTILHQTGPLHEEKIRKSAASLITDPALQSRYVAYGTLPADRMAMALDAAAIVIARAGSGTIFEIALKGKPSILIPIPEDISRDQRSNAYSYARSGAATVIEEQNLTDDLLVSEIRRILEDKTAYQDMQTAARNFTVPDAADKLADTLISIGKEHE
ncbi:MAG: UDP-N-acetylglucosamine--N-acetylmuramyl-(pentapeptide) pyrophosphoryl-undecaprenol N-acetylglucosamine transferase [Candidatus Paceibacterota bacterium]